MKKAAVVCFAVVLMLSGFHLAQAQETGKTYKIGYLGPSSVNTDFLQRLRELGYVEGKNLTVEFRRGKNLAQYPSHAAELVHLNVDCILTIGVTATRAAKNATATIPIVMGNASADPVQLGLVDSLAQPGGNITGVFDLMAALAGKRLEVLNETLPNLSQVAHISIADSPVPAAHFKATEVAARRLGIKVKSFEVPRPNDLERFYQLASEGGTDALIVVGVGFFLTNEKRIIDLEVKHRLPTMHTLERWVGAGGLMTYTTDATARHRRAAEYVDKVLKGVKPTDLPVEQPTRFVFGVNLKTANKIGLTIPPNVLARAAMVIK